MDIFDLVIWDDEGEACSFYSVQKEGSKYNETDKFFLKYENDSTHKEELETLLQHIQETVGNRHGALNSLFSRTENEVIALPHNRKVYLDEVKHHFPDFPFRLYALRINERIVILFNGGVKDARTIQTTTTGLSMKWHEACHFAKRIAEAINDGVIIIDNKTRKLLNSDGTEEITL